MKRFYFSFCLFCISLIPIFGQSGIAWNDPITFSTTQGDKSPVVKLLGDGTPVMIWGKSSTIYFSKFVDGNFTSPVSITTGGSSPNIYSFGGIDMATFDNQIHLVYENFDNGVFQIRSLDDGASFETPVNVYNPAAGKWATLASIDLTDQGQPIVSVILENTNETNGQYIVMTSNDLGLTFNDPVVANEPAMGDYVCECCTSDIYSKGDNIWLIFRNNDNNLRDMWVSKSSDGGLSFTEATDIDDTDWILMSCPISGPKMAPLGADSLMSIWLSGASGQGKTYLSTIHAGTMEIGHQVELLKLNPNSSHGQSAIAGANDTIGIVWTENGFGANGTDLLFGLSKNGSQGLVDNFENITNLPGTQRFPSLAFGNGAFHLIYTNGQGGLDYRKGVVTDISSTSKSIPKIDCLQLLEQPINSNQIQITYSCSEPMSDVKIQLLSSDGRLLYADTKKKQSANSKISINNPGLGAGTYFLRLDSNKGTWSSQILMR